MEAYPLHWPIGWPRTNANQRLNRLPGGYGYAGHWDAVTERLYRNLEKLDGLSAILSTNQPLRRDGLPYKNSKIIADPGAAIYFELNQRPMVMAQDRYWDLADNIRSLALALEGMRQMNRHGGAAMMERAFAGFAALPPPGNGRDFHEILRVGAGTTLDECETQYRALAKEAGEGHADLYTLNAAIKEARANFADR